MRSRTYLAAAAALLFATTLGLAQRWAGARRIVHAAEPEALAAAGDDVQAAGLPPDATTIWSSQDNVRGVELVLAESATHYHFGFRPFDPPPRYRPHLTRPTRAASGYVEHDDGLAVERWEMSPSDDGLWTRVPKPAAPQGADGRYRIGAWAPGANSSDPDEAFFWIEADLVLV